MTKLSSSGKLMTGDSRARKLNTLAIDKTTSLLIRKVYSFPKSSFMCDTWAWSYQRFIFYKVQEVWRTFYKSRNRTDYEEKYPKIHSNNFSTYKFSDIGWKISESLQKELKLVLPQIRWEIFFSCFPFTASGQAVISWCEARFISRSGVSGALKSESPKFHQ